MNTTLSFSNLRTLAFCAACLAAPLQANALTLTIPTNALNVNGIKEFSENAVKGLKAVDITVTAHGNASSISTTPLSFNLPVTKFSVDGLKPAGGGAVGSALIFTTVNQEDKTLKLVLANFMIDFTKHLVLADATYKGKTLPSTPIYTFNEQTPLVIKYKFPLGITAHQVLDKLFLTPEAKTAFKKGLDIGDFADPILDKTDWGTLIVDARVSLRSKPVSTKPYVPAP